MILLTCGDFIRYGTFRKYMSGGAMTAKTPQFTLTPYLACKDSAAAIAFYTKAFGAKESFRLTDPAGKIGHAEITLGETVIMLSDENPAFGHISAQTLGGCPVLLHLYVADVDAFVKDAVKGGATLLRPVENEFDGDRTGQIADPFGFKWMIATRTKQVSPGEMQRLWTEALSGA
jgi:PhnB protein